MFKKVWVYAPLAFAQVGYCALMQERKRLIVEYMWHFIAMNRARKCEALECKEQLSRGQAEEEELKQPTQAKSCVFLQSLAVLY
jgi:hypothetical protein